MDYMQQPSQAEAAANQAQQVNALHSQLGAPMQSMAGPFAQPSPQQSIATPQQMPTGATEHKSLMDMIGRGLRHEYGIDQPQRPQMYSAPQQGMVAGQGIMGIDGSMKRTMEKLMQAAMGGGL